MAMSISPTKQVQQFTLTDHGKSIILTDQDLNGRSAGEHRTSLMRGDDLNNLQNNCQFQYTSIYYDETTSQYKDTRCNQ